MKFKPQSKNTGSHTKMIIAIFLITLAVVLPFFIDGYGKKLVSGGFSASGTGTPDKNTATGEGSGETVDVDKALQLGYQLIYIERAVDEKFSRTDYVKLANIAPELKDAIVAIEDNRFYRHRGIDAEGVCRAMLVNLQSGSVVEGGSTITQQLAKNLFLSQERSWRRKFEEIILAARIEYNYSKDDILEMYLNTIYFGSGAYGIGKATAIYFDKPPNALNLAESSLLAGLPNAPSVNSPYVNMSAAKKRQALVLDAMVRYEYIDSATAQEAKTALLKLAR